MQLHQQKGMISLSPPTICNSASDKAHRILKRLSEVDGCSLSEVIEKRLARAYKNTWDHK
uniref:Uncharacterized protein n=1 Tax=Klebsiella pneumoniae TaxID=573 RepID=A0A5P5X6R3_KLEPN|nr:hypothetical protein [Klebsiella pneumoniae]